MCIHCQKLAGADATQYCEQLGLPRVLKSPLVSARYRAKSRGPKETASETKDTPMDTPPTLLRRLHAQVQLSQEQQHAHYALKAKNTVLTQELDSQLETQALLQCKLQAQHGFIASMNASRQESMSMVQNYSGALGSLHVVLESSNQAIRQLQAANQVLASAVKSNSASAMLQSTRQVLTHGPSNMTLAQGAFLKAWTKRCHHTRGAKMDDLMVELAILASYDMPKQTYDTFKPFLNLPSHDWAVKLRKKHANHFPYTVGDNPQAWQLATKLYAGACIVITSDGTRVSRAVGQLHNSGLVGRCFPPDVRHWPSGSDPVPATLQQLKEYIDICRGESTILSHELCTVAAHCTTQASTKSLPLMLFPEPTFGFSTFHHILLMLDAASKTWLYGIHSFGESTDSCSTGISAGLAIMTPAWGTMRVFKLWLGLDIPSFKFFAPLVASGPMPHGDPDGYHEFWWSWYGETAHTNRNLRKNTGAGTRRLVTGILEDLTECIATLSLLKEVGDDLQAAATQTPDLLSSFNDMSTLKNFRDQNNKAAYAFISVPTMAACAAAPRAHPLLLYMLIGFYLFEPWYNPNFTSPYYVALFQWTAKTLLDLLEAHIELYDLDKRWHLLSGTTRRTMDSMAHTGIHHFLKGYRKASQGAFSLGANWKELSLKKVNTNPLEGYHGACRTDGNDFNKTLAQWIHLVSAMVLKQNLREDLACKHNFTPAMPRNRTQAQREPTLYAASQIPAVLRGLMGVAAGLTPAHLLHHSTQDAHAVNHPARSNIKSYSHLMDVMAAGCKAGEENGANVLSQLAPQAHAVLLEHGRPLKAKEWHGKPPAFDVVRTDTIAGVLYGPVTPQMYAQHTQAQGPMGEAQLPEVAEVGEVQDGWDFSNSATHKHREAKESYDSLLELLKGLSGPTASNSNSGLSVSSRTGEQINLQQALSVWQRKEWVSRDRGPRFWVYNLPEHKKLPHGHNCTLGTLLVVRYAPNNLLLVKVHRMDRIRAEEHVRSCKLVAGAGNQLLTVEVCWQVPPPTGCPTDGINFEASGVFLPSLDARKVALVSPCMHEPTIGSCACAITVASVAECTVNKETFLTAGGFSSLRPNGILCDDIEAGNGDSAVGPNTCCRCRKGWWDDCTGPVLQCSGPCMRWFHSDCAGVDFKDDWQCLLCTGVDTAVCASCNQEWFSDDKLRRDGSVNPYYTGSMLQCDGQNCGLWYHQQCHQPRIPDSHVAPATSVTGKKRKKANFLGKKWHCAACIACTPAQQRPSKKQSSKPNVDIADPPSKHTVVKQWICVSCDTMNAADVNTCGHSDCQKARSHFGCDIVESEGGHRTSSRQTRTRTHEGTLPWDGIRLADNATNVQQMHSSLQQPTLQQSPQQPQSVPQDVVMASTQDVLRPQWMCISCQTINAAGIDTCGHTDCRKFRSECGVNISVQTTTGHRRSSRKTASS